MSATDSHRLSGLTAIVTGASRGIGLAVAHRLVAEGARVCITARTPEPLAAAAAQFPEGSVLALAGAADDPRHRCEVLDAVARSFSRLDILVNNAGINPVYGTLMELDLAAARKIAEVNIFGALAWVQDAYHHPELDFAARGGSVINISSVSGQTPASGLGFYGVSKAAIEHLTRSLAAEMGPRVRVNAVAPAVVKTQFARALYVGREAAVAAHYPLGRLGTPEDVAAAVAFLASSDAAWITGQVLNLDGGLLAAGGTA
ncbi:SDR family oxidoreductase [Arthrobacter sp. H14-L1]|uniref:SDR family oxidoreductase n=1 Tax=Arthrobacter sp. H14-L1 TaxID=2996697 RepID=UPI0022703E83|nr:SDR family oxidoreductase [Arthrobacter sp. H14-L1]MCY0905218.1 SDR family oxidoreductase [Arthrobacter sp. H14-L1]